MYSLPTPCTKTDNVGQVFLSRATPLLIRQMIRLISCDSQVTDTAHTKVTSNYKIEWTV